MHSSGQMHLLQSHEKPPTSDLGLEKFRPTVADAFCYYVVLGQTYAPIALHFMAPDNDKLLKRRVKYAYDRLVRIVGRRFNEFPAASLEAYFLSPLICEWPKLIRKFRGKNSEQPVAGSSSASLASEKVELSTMMPVPAVEPPTAVATAVAEVEHSTCVEPVAVAALANAADAAEENSAEYKVGDLVSVKGISAPGNRGYRCFGMSSAHIVEDRGGGIYLVSQAGANPELPFGSMRRVYAYQLTRLEETKTVGDSVNERSGDKSVSRIRHKKTWWRRRKPQGLLKRRLRAHVLRQKQQKQGGRLKRRKGRRSRRKEGERKMKLRCAAWRWLL